MTLLQLILLLLLIFLILAIIIPLLQSLIYTIQQYQFRSKQPSTAPLLGHVYTRHSFPLGIPAFARLLYANYTYTTPEALKSSICKAQGRKTHRRQILGRYVFFTIDPQNVKAMLATQFEDFALGPRSKALEPLLGAGVFTVDGTAWRHARGMLRPQFARDQVSQVGMMGKHVELFLGQVEHATKDGGVVDIQELLFLLTLDTATEFLFGDSVGALEGKGKKDARETRSFGEAFTKAQRVLAHRVRAQGFCDAVTVAWPEFSRWCLECRTYTERFVLRALERANQEDITVEGENKKKENKKRYVFLEELAKHTRDPDVLRDAALNVLLAGRDTTASSLAWAFYHLAKDITIQRRLRKILRGQFCNSETGEIEGMTFEGLKRCKYLQYVIKETLRLHPPVPVNVRTATCDTTLPRGGYCKKMAGDWQSDDEDGRVFVPKGSSVFYSAVAMHTDESVWDYGEEFLPSRWEGNDNQDNDDDDDEHEDDNKEEKERKKKRNFEKRVDPWQYIPFNGGPRVCLGQQFALTELGYVIARVVLYFEEIRLDEKKMMGGREEEEGRGFEKGFEKGKVKALSDAQVTLSVAGGVWIRVMRNSGQI
ncbi:uncharacterized protein SAPINGB_P002311 [Magnusiomyces paraingens]|uniref:Cytochrome P450 n=1 Tax=Magnusiomyces paraingens TaxID=2606893 RepID=A0A5E8BD49_9ASCO|nr:uncharacterized protein SAPINGB_P002311 [Saprochaete ingens]VVT49523.1 unnamed protein product [Saprochaete ingens]